MLATMGNEVLAQRPFADVAREKSDGPTARDGGIFDWTSQGSLASKRLDEAVFSLPVGQLSAIIEDETSLNMPDRQSLHIVRVLERIEAGQTPFLEAQVSIRQALLEERRKKASDEYLTKLRERTPVWTIFDDEPAADGDANARPAGPRR
jgi:parvulin-like peptidyl-prolyl isomerase